MPVSLPHTAVEAFWDEVRTTLRKERVEADRIEEGIRAYRDPIREKDAEAWIYHREPADVAEDIRRILADASLTVGSPRSNP